MLISGKPKRPVGSDNMLRLHAICSSAVSQDIASALDEVELVTLESTTGGLQDAQAALARKQTPDVLMVELDAANPNDLADLASIVETSNGLNLPVIATSEVSSIQAVRQLLHLGVADFVPQPITRSDLLSAVEVAVGRKNVATAAKPVRSGRVISVMMSSGGAGATTTAVELAHELLHGPKKSRRRVCLIDLDLQFGNVALRLDLEPKRTIRDLVRDAEKVDAALFDAVLTHHDSGLSVVAAPRELVMPDLLAPLTVKRILDLAAQTHDYVVVDLPSYWTTWTPNVLGASHAVVLVAQITVPAIRAARRRLDFMRAEGMGQVPVVVVANRYDGGHLLGGRKGPSKSEVEKALGHPIDYSVASDFKRMNEAQNRGVVLSVVKPSASIAKRFRRFAAIVAERCETGQPAAGTDDKPQSRTEG